MLSGVFAIGCAQLTAAPLASAEQTPLGHLCKAQNGVRFCPTEGLAQRVPSFDGVPLDVDVTLPPTGEGPFPTIVMMHGWETTRPRSSRAHRRATGTRATTTTTSNYRASNGTFNIEVSDLTVSLPTT
jgi:hypothetical protein